MKKLSIFLFGALALAAVSSCDEAPVAPPMQSNPQEPLLVAGDITAQAAGALTSTDVLSLEAAKSDLNGIEVAELASVQNLPEGAVVSLVLELSNSADFAKVKKLSTRLIDDKAYVDVTEWNTAHLDLFGKSPKEKTAYWRIPVYVELDGTTYRYDSTDFYVGEGTITETCQDAGFVIYDNYYLLGDCTTWTMSAEALEPYKFKHSDADVYDDPVFYIIFEVAEGGTYWKIAPQLSLDEPDRAWDVVLGTEQDGDENLSGMLVDTNANAGRILDAGKYKMTINVEEMTYDIVAFSRPEYLCTPNKANSWTQALSQWLYYTDNDDKPYFYGVAMINPGDGGFKLTDGASWDNDKTWGLGDAEGTLTQPGDNIPVPETGLYWITANLDALTYTTTAIETVGLIGEVTGWGSDIELTPDESGLIYSTTLALDGSWKIRFNGNWDMNFGGDLAKPNLDGGNFEGFTGEHTVTVDFSGNWPVITVTPRQD